MTQDPRVAPLTPSVASSRQGLNKTIAKLVFGLGCCISLAIAIVFGTLPLQLQPGMREMLVISCGLLALGFALALRLLRRVSTGVAVMAAGWSACLVVSLSAVGLGDGVHSVSLGFFGLLVCLLTVLTSLRAGLVLAGACAAVIGALAWAEHQGWLPGSGGAPRHPVMLYVLLHALMLVTAVVSGMQMSYMMSRALAEAELREQRYRASESRYRELFSLSPTPLVLHREGITLLANDASARLFGLASAEAMVGFDLAQLYPAETRGQLRARLHTLSQHPLGKSLDLAEFVFHALDGRRLTVQANGSRVDAADGPATLSLFHDITERVGTEAALRRSQAMLSHLFATSPDFITLSDMETGVYVMVNDSFSRMFGYAAQEVVGKSALELGIWYAPEDRKKMVAELRAHGGVNEVETLFMHKSGEIVTLLMSAGSFTMDGRAYLVVNGRDVTEAQRARLEHEAILKNASIGIALTREKHFTQANPRFESMFGWGSGEMIGQSAALVWASEDDFREANRTIGPLLAQGKLVDLERQMVRRDGTPFWCRLLAQVVDPTHPALSGTIWIAEDVTERRQIDQALAAARDVAEAANRAKSAFLANTSHEIRTPLNGLLGLANLAMQPGLEVARRQQYLEQIQDSAQSLAGIISDILDLSKIEAGKFSIEAVAFNLHSLLRAVHHAYQSLAHARSLDLTLHIAEGVPATVSGDPVRLRQILSNYITNGLKFTARGRVSLEVRMSGGRVRFTVSDTGQGIDAATQARLFQPFTQADDSTTRRFGGTGLGLSICKELASLMEGEVGVDSIPGQGSHFWAELPLPMTDAPVIDPRMEAQDIERLGGMRVLLVEDNPVNMMIGVAMLEQWGVQVTQATDGLEGVAAVERACAEQRPFHAVLMDVQMPQLSGHEAARRLRREHSAAELPIIALTAAALVSEREEALAAGMNDFLTKPIDVHKLRQALVRAAGVEVG